MRIRTGIVVVAVCLLTLSGGAAWAQPAPGGETPTITSWSGWVQGVQAWLVGLWPGASGSQEAPAPEATYQAQEDPDDGGSTALELPGTSLETSESCKPGFETCSADPNG